MQLNEIFAKDVQRPIEGVIKADDVAHLGTEVEEYVLTNEAAKGLELLLEEYTNYTNANGVWISGFFGSGKSHLLKMLAHLLGDVEGQDFDRAKVSESFRAKTSDAFLPALLNKADAHPGQEPAVQHRPEGHAHQQGPDRRLAQGVRQGLRREPRLLRQPGPRRPLRARPRQPRPVRRVQGGVRADRRHRRGPRAASRARSKGASIDRPSPRSMARPPTASSSSTRRPTPSRSRTSPTRSRRGSTSRPEGFRLNFFVDEVGQFIGSNTHLMLNLQTIAETLNTKCAGRAWVFVTSQEDMDKVVGDRTKQQGNDFSKIQARFKTRVKLTSADVEEVIRKRLLEKNDAGAAELKAIYAKESANFKTLFDFVDGAKTYRNYTDEAALRRHLPVRQLPVPAVPGRDRGHLRPQRLRGPQQLGR